MLLPTGFAEFYLLFSEDYEKFEKPSSLDELWDKLLWALLLHKRPEAHVNWFHSECLKDGVFSYQNVRSSDFPKLKNNALRFIKRVSDCNTNDVVRQGILSEYRALFNTDLECCLINGIISASEFVNGEVEPDFSSFLNLFDNPDKTFDLVAQLVFTKDSYTHGRYKTTLKDKYFLCQIGLVKAILWVHSMGFGEDLCTPNSHHKDFLQECGFGGFDDREITEIKDYSIFNKKMLAVRDELRKRLKQVDITLGSLDLSVFYYESTKKLLSGKKKSDFTAEDLIGFMKNQKIDITDLGERIADIDRCEELRKELKRYAEEYI